MKGAKKNKKSEQNIEKIGFSNNSSTPTLQVKKPRKIPAKILVFLNMLRIGWQEELHLQQEFQR